MRTVLSDHAIAQLIEEDVPYGDLTTVGLGIGDQPGRIEFYARHPMVLCASEEAARVFEQCGATVQARTESGTLVEAGQRLLQAEGTADALHVAWRIALNLMEYTSGIATRTQQLVQVARRVNPAATLVGTRKVFPGTRRLSVKGLLAGGAVPHRLGLSETILIFKEHLIFLEGLPVLLERLPELKQRFQEQKITVEVETLDDAWAIAEAGVDIIQLDKVAWADLSPMVQTLKQSFPGIKLAIAGGITLDNVEAYASTGIDLLVTSYPYFGKPADIGVKMLQRETR